MPSFKKNFLSVLTSTLIIVLHLFLISAHNKPVSNISPVAAITTAPLIVAEAANNTLLNNIATLYDSMDLDLKGLSKQTFEYAMKGFNHLVQTGQLVNDRIISIADFSQPSSKKRLFVIDLEKAEVVFNTYVAHGVNTGALMAKNFSNEPESLKSSPGFYQTLGTYIGGHGYSLKLEGLERGINDNANRRAIVIHAAAYANEGFIKAQGFLGRSWGCPALPEKLCKPIINKIKGGTCLFIYSPDKSYINRSKIINA